MVGQRFTQTLKSRDTAGQWRVTVVAGEPHRAYDRVNLSACFDGTAAAELDLVPEGCYDGDGYRLLLAETATAIDTRACAITTTTRTLGYDALVLATGSRPFIPPVPGSDTDGCFAYRTLDDLAAIRARAERAARTCRGRPAGLVVGGGLLGLEAARGLRALGLSPHVVELAPRLMPLQVDEGGGGLLKRMIEDLNVTVHLGTGVASIERFPRDRLLATLASGTQLDVDLVVFAAGVRPADQLARTAGLAVGPKGGIVVDEGCRTSEENIYAIGECACAAGTVYGLVAPGYAMADVLAARLTDPESGAAFTGADTSTKLKLLGVDVASFGDALARTDGALEVTVNDPVARSYAKLVVSPDAATLLGGVLVGDASRYAALRPLVGRPLPGDPVAMITPGAGPGTGLAELPADAQICTCNAITKGTILAAIDDGAADIATLKSCTRAGTSCGSCVPALKSLLAESGAVASTALCEHFTHSRAQLFEHVQKGGITTFTELIERHGTGGRGCDICKPVVASILASLGHGAHILDGEQASLQDTNDRFLANLQRNGTYSVVPRIPGGEITPDKLIAVGEVARDFGLYVKITGGQRVDLLGARVEELPDIWRRLVDAGFESGHAYGKAVRTVKSCVGSTWCRYGVQDSVGMAIALELRYRGIRAPHKIKAGVSGCARECAEARSKDIGVIATESGWNLYVGGNGGFRPRHADLLASSVDSQTLVRLIDRFIMFYIRTADRLQRTAAWLESLEGGLGYLRSVIDDDSLGICAELDAAVERHVSGYTDEWAAVLADPGRLRGFVSFVNAPHAADPSIEFVTERGQPVPVTIGAPA
jgi:nitrite reductase (NADH) large subunit